MLSLRVPSSVSTRIVPPVAIRAARRDCHFLQFTKALTFEATTITAGVRQVLQGKAFFFFVFVSFPQTGSRVLQVSLSDFGVFFIWSENEISQQIGSECI